jgi:hypothetical protein
MTCGCAGPPRCGPMETEAPPTTVHALLLYVQSGRPRCCSRLDHSGRWILWAHSSNAVVRAQAVGCTPYDSLEGPSSSRAHACLHQSATAVALGLRRARNCTGASSGRHRSGAACAGLRTAPAVQQLSALSCAACGSPRALSQKRGRVALEPPPARGHLLEAREARTPSGTRRADATGCGAGGLTLGVSAQDMRGSAMAARWADARALYDASAPHARARTRAGSRAVLAPLRAAHAAEFARFRPPDVAASLCRRHRRRRHDDGA